MAEFRDISQAAAAVQTLGFRPDVIEMAVADLVRIGSPMIHAHFDTGYIATLLGMSVRPAPQTRVGYFTKEALGSLSRNSWYIRKHGEGRRSWINIGDAA